MIYQDNRVTGFLVVIAGVFFMSFDPLLIRLVETDSWTTAFWFGVFTFIAMGIYVPVVDKTNYFFALRMNFFPLIVYALCMVGSASSLILSVNLTLASNTIVILSATPLFAAILSRVFLKEHIPVRTWSAILICMAGIGLVFSGSFGKGSLLGDYFALQTTIFVACLHTIMRRFKQINRAVAVGLGGLAVSIVSFYKATPFSLSMTQYFFLAVWGMFTGPLGRILINTGPRYIQAPEVGLIALLNTFFAPFWVWIIFKELPGQATIAGGLIIILTLCTHTILGLRNDRLLA